MWITDIFSNLFSVSIPFLDFPVAQMIKNLSANAGGARNVGWIPGLGRSPGIGTGNPLQYSRLENPMDGGAWWATVRGVAKSWTRLSEFTFTFTFIEQLV